ncbi:MAG: DUF4445 domain-containing protein [Candidatus Aminicenantes bacterium]|nr:DUF4445 domain-containing protein [Candidatus Aminicenantes bacterium]
MKIRILTPDPRTIETESGGPLSAALTNAGIPLNVYCGGRGLCGRCLVEIVEGRLRPPEMEERDLLNARQAPPGVRLACCIQVESDLAVRLVPEALLGEVQGLTEGILPSFAFDPPVKRLPFRLEPEEAAPPLLERCVAGRLKLPLDDLWERHSGPVLREAVRSPGDYTAVVFDNQVLLDVADGPGPGPAFGLAVDLGTTTAVVELVDLDRGLIAGRAVGPNRQARFGSDLISRIARAVRDRDDAEELRRAALDTLSALQARVCSDARVPAGAIYDIVVAGNTVMNHLLLGRPVRSLAESPFEADFLEMPPVEAVPWGFDVHRRAKLFLAPNIGSYIGGDITAGLVATGMLGRPGNALFIDLGTNGEIVLKRGEDVTAASTAAGPAFEGAGLSSGIAAVPGAVEAASWAGESLTLSVIGDRPATGICGSGYIDLLAAFLSRGLISTRGALNAAGGLITVAPAVAVSRQDVRALQLAVAAVRTGVALLLRRAGLAPSDLDVVYLAGAFGNRLNAANARRIGLLPAVDADRLRCAGNTSLAGARAMLLSRPARAEAARLASRIEHVSLASDPAFQDTYIRSLSFPESDAIDSIG